MCPTGKGSPGTRSAGSMIQRVASPSVDVSWVAKTVSGLKTCRQIRDREACLSGVRLLSDHQPDRLRVDYQSSGPPHIWLHTNPMTAWIIVDIATRAWSQLCLSIRTRARACHVQ